MTTKISTEPSTLSSESNNHAATDQVSNPLAWQDEQWSKEILSQRLLESSPLFEINSPVQRKLKAISKCTRHGPAWKPLCDLVSSMQDGQLVNTIRASPADDTDPQHRTSDTTSPVKMTTRSSDSSELPEQLSVSPLDAFATGVMEELRFRNTPLHDLGTQVLETLAARNQVSRIDTPTKTSALGKVLNEFLDQGRVAEPQTKVGVFWDYENCPVPSAASVFDVMNGMRPILTQYGRVSFIQAYAEVKQINSERVLRINSELMDCGVTLVDSPHNGSKNAVDSMILVDMMFYALDNPKLTTIILISGDRDFVAATSKLTMMRIPVVLIAPPSCHVTLKRSCMAWHSWYDVVPFNIVHAKSSIRNADDVEDNDGPHNVDEGDGPDSGMTLVEDSPLKSAQDADMDSQDTRTAAVELVASMDDDRLSAALAEAIVSAPMQKMRRVKEPEPEFLQLVQWMETMRLANKSVFLYWQLEHYVRIRFLRLPGVEHDDGQVVGLEEYMLLAETAGVAIIMRNDGEIGFSATTRFALHPAYTGVPSV